MGEREDDGKRWLIRAVGNQTREMSPVVLDLITIAPYVERIEDTAAGG